MALDPVFPDEPESMIVVGLRMGVLAERLAECPECGCDTWWLGRAEFLRHALACAKIAIGLNNAKALQ